MRKRLHFEAATLHTVPRKEVIMAQDHSYGHAVVAGGSMAGLLVASVLAKHFTQVTVVERDLLPVEAGAHRRGVQQSKHVHALLAAGLQAMEKLTSILRP
jgi:ribulose 1,5-bisphosphate synthetase/thiazole synthase